MRIRHQDGWVEERGSRWYGHYYVYVKDEAGKETRRHVGVGLGGKATLRKWEAKAKLAGIIKSTTKGDPRADDQTLRWYVEEKFLPMMLPTWAPSTRETNKYHAELLLADLGTEVLSDLNKFTCQTFLNKLAEREYSFTVIDHCRTLLRVILEEAVEAELVGKNVARKLAVPELPKTVKPVLDPKDARALFDALPFRDRLITMIAAFCALRPGEIFGLRWSSIEGDNLNIQGTAWRGQLRDGTAKTAGSLAKVAIPRVLMPMLGVWQEQYSTAPADSLIFPSEKGPHSPLRPENWLRRRIKPVAKKLGITVPVHFQILRRTFATQAQGLGSPKDLQTHLRHSTIATAQEHYVQPVEASTRRLVNRVAHSVMKQ